MSIAITRCGNLYGPGHTNFSTLIPSTIRRVIRGERPHLRSDGTPRRDYLFVEDAVSGYLALLDHPDRRGAYNFGTKRPSSAIDVVRIILRLMHSDLDPVPGKPNGEIADQWLDWSRAEADLGWRPRHSLEEGLRKTIPWYEENFGRGKRAV